MDKAHVVVPARAPCEDIARTAILEQFRGKSCWQMGKYLGSMLYFDFGQKIQSRGRHQQIVERGEASLGIRDCYWSLGDGMQTLIDSDSITDAKAAGLLAQVHGASLTQVAPGTPDRMCFVFSNGWVLTLDISNRYGTEDDIAEIVLPDGSIHGVTPQGCFHTLSAR